MIRLIVLLVLVVGLAPPAVAQSKGLGFARAAQEAESRQDFDRAVALYTEAIMAGDLSPKTLADVLHYRGNARFFLGRHAAAGQDYEQSLRLNPSNIYVVLWLYLAEQRSGQGARDALRRRTGALDLFYWPGPVVSLFLEERAPEKVLLDAQDPFLDEDSQREQLCEALFYVGQYYLARGRKAAAADHFRRALATGATDFVEYEASRAELGRLGG